MSATDQDAFGDEDSLIRRGARALARDPGVIASALTGYQAQTGRGEADLAAWLGLSLLRLHALALCTKPEPTDTAYEQTIHATAAYIGCDEARLRLVLEAERRTARD